MTRSFPALLVGVLLGCTSAGAEGRVAVIEQLQHCQLMSDGEAGRIPSQLYAPTACYQDCLAGASCEALRQELCGESFALGLECDERCAYRCDDGALLRPDQECDGRMDCAGGEDEGGCDPPMDPGCRWATACDGRVECLDGRDEEGCGSFFCDDGAELAYRERCDGYRRCPGGEDEAFCAVPTYTCL